MNKIRGWFRLLGFMLVLWRKSASQKLAWEWKRKAAKQLRLLNRASKKLKKDSDRLRDLKLRCDEILSDFESDLSKTIKDAETKVETAQHNIRQFDKVEESLNDDLKVREAGMEALSLLNDELKQHTASNIAVLTRKEVAVLPHERLE